MGPFGAVTGSRMVEDKVDVAPGKDATAEDNNHDWRANKATSEEDP